MSDFIPFELQVEILKSIPVKSLIRFRSVSKEWKSLIDSSEFVTGYKVSQEHFFVSYLDLDCHKLKFVSITDDDAFPKHKFSISPPSSLQLFGTKKIVGSSQGLFCLYDSRTNVATVWNPSIRKSVNINVPSIRLSNMIYKWPSDLGFGVCPITSDPKLIKITYLKCVCDKNGEITSGVSWHVDVFKLSTRECTSVCINWASDNLELHSDQVDIVGHIYWVATKSTYLVIVSYDITSEVFTEICLPDTFKSDMRISISKLRNSLAVLRSDISGFSVWKMENGDHKLFTKLFTIKNIFNATIFSLVGFSNSGVPKFKRANGDKKDALVVYEPRSLRLSYKGKEYYFNVRYYMESLLLHDQ